MVQDQTAEVLPWGVRGSWWGLWLTSSPTGPSSRSAPWFLPAQTLREARSSSRCWWIFRWSLSGLSGRRKVSRQVHTQNLLPVWSQLAVCAMFFRWKPCEYFIRRWLPKITLYNESMNTLKNGNILQLTTFLYWIYYEGGFCNWISFICMNFNHGWFKSLVNNYTLF